MAKQIFMISFCGQVRLEMRTQQENVDTITHVRGTSLYELLQAERLQAEQEQAERLQLEQEHAEEMQLEQPHTDRKQSKPKKKERRESNQEQVENLQSDQEQTERLQSDQEQTERIQSENEQADKQFSENQHSGKAPTDKHCKSNKSKREKHASGPQKKLELLLSHCGNRECADCGTPEPKWVSMGVGVFICIKCSGIHRSLGVHITQVLSVKLDDWTEDQVDALEEMGGNIVANKKYEACIPGNILKPKPDSAIEERSDFIRRKYELQQFINSDECLMCPYPRPTCSSTYRSPSAYRTSSSKNLMLSLDKKHIEKQVSSLRITGIGHAFRGSRHSSKRKDEHKSSKNCDLMPGMTEFVGLIKVNVVRGTNLAIRDMVSSDPYVILCLGQQSVKTRIIKNNLNPVWNEKLMLSIPDCLPPLKLLVYDKDTFTTDDFMGQAEIDIQPLVSAARDLEKSTQNGATQLGTWVASEDNTLLNDSIISLVDGQIKQQLSIKLQNVERGVLDLELECVPLSQ
ncbi:probable ADP-ribosylation factor GTPase-activating protein AGD11 [Chenopodium quinoa]|uniref:probable ADP-ribosylation factor GTPase-activating protein AGD11 n=1 Tax=Chenopodium quinoa TaxID=63459 RepID=UPI000B77E178|nr:probable ADP-ribosylation factor GTPase-activating protein AGD11 [Chenopodium quinoa]XP_021774442.1 probable ADP-ribosylation factor GTPase-activating protein AGD11 [Chenopodium quinoa]